MTKKNWMPNRLRMVLLTAAATAVLGVAGAGRAAAACVNDVDCPNPACGGDVCTWDTRGMTCEPAGSGPDGRDGWCTTDADCKCFAMGARCMSFYCSFTKPPAGATGGASGTATGGSSGTATGGSTGTATGGSSGTATGGSGTTPPKDSGGGGCAIAPAPASGLFGVLAGAGLLGALLAGRSRRRRG